MGSNSLSALLNRWAESIRLFSLQNYKFVFLVFFAGYFAYGYEMGQLNFGIDEEYNWTDLDACYQWYGKIGRWMLIAYDQMFLHWAHYPFISGFLALFMFSVAYAAWLGTHKDASFTAKLLFGSLAISFPTFGHMLMFSYQIAFVAASSALVIFAYLLAVKTNNFIYKYVISTIFLALALLTYQSLIIIFFALFFIDNFFNIFRFDFIKKSLLIVFLAILSVALYLISDNVLKFIYNVDATDYLSYHFVWGNGNFEIIYANMKKFLAELLSGDIYTFTVFPILVIPAIILLLTCKNRMEIVASLILLYLFSVALFVLFGTHLPSRIFIYLPILYSGLFYLAYKITNIIGKYVVVITSLYIVITNASINTQLSMQTTFANLRDQIVTGRVVNEIYDNAPNYMALGKKTLICGAVAEKIPKVPSPGFAIGPEAYGASFWAWDGGSPWRIKSYLYALGIPLPEIIDAGQGKAIMEKEDFKKMPNYPDSGFVRLFDDVLVIKLSSPQ